MASKVYETAIKIGATISRAFKSDTLGAAGALGKLTDAQKKLRAAEGAAKSVGRLSDAVTKAKERYNVATESLRKLEAAERAAGGATKESTRWRTAGNKEIARAAKELDRATAAAEKNARAMGDLSKMRFEVARERLFGPRKEKEQIPLLHKAGSQIAGIANDVKTLGLMATGAGAALGGLVLQTIHTGDEIGDTAERIGIGAEALQQLRYGAKRSGAEAQDLDKSLGKMLVTVGKFKNAKPPKDGGGGLSIAGMQMLGTGGESAGPEQDPFKRIGLNAKTLAKLKPDEQLNKIADGMSKLKTRADKAAVATAIFGKSGVSLLPLLSKGSAGVAELSAEASKFGGVMSKDAVAAAGEADDAMIDAKMAIAGLTTSLSVAFLPVATKAFKTFSKWVSENRGQIQGWAQSAAKWIEGKGIPALLKIGGAVKTITEKVAAFIDKLGTGNIAIGLAALRLAPLAKTLFEINGALIKAVSSWGAFTKASQGAMGGEGGAPGLMGKAIGKAASLAMLAEAAAVGYAIGTALDKWIGASDWFGKLARRDEDKKDKAFDAAYGGKGQKLKLRTNLSNPLAEAGVPTALVPGLKIVGREKLGGDVNVTIHGDDAREDLSRKMDRAKKAALEAHDRRTANQRRLAFSEVTP
jgi:hypothetical protein